MLKEEEETMMSKMMGFSASVRTKNSDSTVLMMQRADESVRHDTLLDPIGLVCVAALAANTEPVVLKNLVQLDS
jgi:hypothetical protein